jgi:hypothetical protein
MDHGLPFFQHGRARRQIRPAPGLCALLLPVVDDSLLSINALVLLQYISGYA